MVVLAFHDKSTLCATAAVPVPVRFSVVVVGCALLVKVSVALAAPVVCGLNVTVNDALCPAGIVTGSDSPLRLNAPLLEPAPVTVTLAPLAVRVPVAVPLLPTVTLPSASVVGATVSCPAAPPVPVPERGTTKVESDASEIIVTSPFTAPVEAGLNETLKVLLCPGVNVTGTVIPLTLNPAPLAVSEEIVELMPPTLVRVSDRVCVLPTATLPKLRVVGFDTRVPGEVPVPVRGIVNVGFEASEVTVTLPVLVPVESGLNDTLNVALCPAVSVIGAEIPLTLNPVPVTATCETEMLVLPVLVTVSDKVLV